LPLADQPIEEQDQPTEEQDPIDSVTGMDAVVGMVTIIEESSQDISHNPKSRQGSSNNLLLSMESGDSGDDTPSQQRTIILLGGGGGLRSSCNDAMQQTVGTSNNKQQPEPDEEGQERIMERAKGQVETKQSQTVALRGHHGRLSTIGSNRQEQKKHKAARGRTNNILQNVSTIILDQLFPTKALCNGKDQRHKSLRK
jgi:hypothetical protein